MLQSFRKHKKSSLLLLLVCLLSGILAQPISKLFEDDPTSMVFLEDTEKEKDIDTEFEQKEMFYTHTIIPSTFIFNVKNPGLNDTHIMSSDDAQIEILLPPPEHSLYIS